MTSQQFRRSARVPKRKDFSDYETENTVLCSTNKQRKVDELTKTTERVENSPVKPAVCSTSLIPTAVPSKIQTAVPSMIPTAVPSKIPTAVPSKIPTAVPSMIPTVVPSMIPTAVPSKIPTALPSMIPTVVPSKIPTVVPSKIPTALPGVSSNPTSAATVQDTPVKAPAKGKYDYETCRQIFRDRRIPVSTLPASSIKFLASEAETMYEAKEPDDTDKIAFLRRQVSVPDEDEMVLLPEPKKLTNWNDNLRETPCIGSGNVFAYAQTRCDWSVNRVENYTSDHSYLMFKIGHIEKVVLKKLARPKGFTYFLCECKHEQQQQAERYVVTVCLRDNGSVATAWCSCTAGCHGKCKHVMCALFSLEDFVRQHKIDNNEETCTDVAVRWHKTRKQSMPVEAAKLDLRKNRDEEPRAKPTADVYRPVRNVDVEDVTAKLSKLLLGTNASILPFLTNNFPVKPKCPDFTMPDLGEMDNQYKSKKDLYPSYNVTREQALKIENDTRMQNTELWYQLRKYRLTSSVFKSICSRRGNHADLAQQMLKPKSTYQSTAMKHGVEHENIAAGYYKEITGFEIHRSGFVINPSVPYLGASPDRKVLDMTADETFGLLEIKCPDKKSVTECPYLEEKDGKLQLKKIHQYYYQVMGQMAITGCKWCDFFVKSYTDYHLERITFDPEFWSTMREALDNFFFMFYLPRRLELVPIVN